MQLSKEAIRGIISQFVLLFASFAILFTSAGTVNWLNGWIYFSLSCLYQLFSTLILTKVNPALLNARSSIVKKDTKWFDRVFVLLYPVLTLSNLVINGLDAVRFHWSSPPFWLSISGVVLFIFAFSLATWAMAVNKFFEWTVRYQDDRNQYVCKDGPYQFIRHPGYAGLIISVLVCPLILRSYWGLVLSLLLALIIIIRTTLEDQFLQKALPGYREYAGKVKYRLIPYIW